MCVCVFICVLSCVSWCLVSVPENILKEQRQSNHIHYSPRSSSRKMVNPYTCCFSLHTLLTLCSIIYSNWNFTAINICIRVHQLHDMNMIGCDMSNQTICLSFDLSLLFPPLCWSLPTYFLLASSCENRQKSKCNSVHFWNLRRFLERKRIDGGMSSCRS